VSAQSHTHWAVFCLLPHRFPRTGWNIGGNFGIWNEQVPSCRQRVSYGYVVNEGRPSCGGCCLRVTKRNRSELVRKRRRFPACANL